jgi:hypothetical protein
MNRRSVKSTGVSVGDPESEIDIEWSGSPRAVVEWASRVLLGIEQVCEPSGGSSSIK